MSLSHTGVFGGLANDVPADLGRGSERSVSAPRTAPETTNNTYYAPRSGSGRANTPDGCFLWAPTPDDWDECASQQGGASFLSKEGCRAEFDAVSSPFYQDGTVWMECP